MVNVDDEWEYEYDETETEDFYIPLDLSNVPSAQVPMVSQGRPGHPTLLKSRLRALNAARGQPTEFSIDATPGEETTNMGEVQVIGLHTENPLVMYNGQLLSCHWASTIGTDMFFVKPDSGTGHPLRSLPSVDLLSLGSAKLVAKVGVLQPRDDVVESAGAAAALQARESVNVSGDISTEVVSPAAQTTGEQQASVEETRSAPTGFLARLNQAKAKRGETSRLVIAKGPGGTQIVSEEVKEQTAAEQSTSQQPNDTEMAGT